MGRLSHLTVVQNKKHAPQAFAQGAWYCRIMNPLSHLYALYASKLNPKSNFTAIFLIFIMP